MIKKCYKAIQPCPTCTYPVKFLLCLVLELSYLLESHAIPLIQPAEHLPVEVAKETRVCLYVEVKRIKSELDYVASTFL